MLVQRCRAVRFHIVVEPQRQLFEIILTLGSSCRFARLLHCRQQKGNQYRNNRDHDQQLDERKCISLSSYSLRHTTFLGQAVQCEAFDIRRLSDAQALNEDNCVVETRDRPE